MTLIHSKILWYFCAASQFSDIEYLHFGEDGVSYSSYNQDYTVYVDAFLPKETFSEYNTTDVTVKVKLNLLSKILKDVDDIVKIEPKKDRMSFKFQRSEFRAPIVEPVEREKKPDFKPDVKAEIPVPQFQDAIKRASLVSDALRLISHQRGLFLASQSLENEILTKLEGNVSGQAITTYAADKMRAISQVGTEDDVVVLEFAKDGPLRVSYNVLDLLRIVYVVAPIVYEDIYVEETF